MTQPRRCGWLVALGILSLSQAAVAASPTTATQAPLPTLGGGVVVTAERSAFIDLIADAVRKHPGVQASLTKGGIAHAAIAETRAEIFPQVDLNLVTNGRLVTGDPNHTGIDTPNSHRVDAVLSASQLLYDFGATYRRIDAAKYRSEAAAADALADTNSVTLNALTAYFDVIRLRALVVAAEDHLTEMSRVTDMVRARTEVAAAPKSDLLHAQSSIAEADSQRIQYIGDSERAEAIFREAFGFAPGAIALPSFHPAVPSDVESAVAIALQRNPVLLGRDLATDGARAEYQSQHAAQYPKLSAELSATRFAVPNMGPDLNEVALRLQISYSLYSGGAGAARQAESLGRLKQAEFEAETARRAVERTARTALTDISARSRRLQAEDLAVSANQEAALACTDQIAIGRCQVTNLLDLEKNLFDAQVRRITGTSDMELSRYAWLAVAGDLLPFFGVSAVPHL